MKSEQSISTSRSLVQMIRGFQQEVQEAIIDGTTSRSKRKFGMTAHVHLSHLGRKLSQPQNHVESMYEEINT